MWRCLCDTLNHLRSESLFGRAFNFCWVVGKKNDSYSVVDTFYLRDLGRDVVKMYDLDGDIRDA